MIKRDNNKCIERCFPQNSGKGIIVESRNKNYLSVLGIMSSIVTLVSFFATAQSMKVDIKCVVTIFIVILILFFMGMWWHENHHKCVNLKTNNMKIRIQEGNIFELLDKETENQKGEISVIAVNDYYDTIVDD